MSIRHYLSILIAASSLSGQASALLMSPRDMPAIPTAASSPAIQRYEAGLQALIRKDWRAAETAFLEATRLDPASPLPLIGLADVAMQNKRPNEAWSWLEKAVKAAPQSGQPYHAMGRFHYNNKAFAQAENAFKKALALSPDSALFNLDMADLYASSLKKPEAALAFYRKAISQNPQHAGAHQGQGMALISLGKNMEAEAALRKAGELARDNPIPWQALGKLLADQNKMDSALAAYQQALKIQPDFLPALMGRGDIFLGQGNMQQALPAYQQAVKQAPQYDLAYLKMGMALQGLNRPKEAETAYKAAVTHNPKLALAYNNLAWLAADSRANLAQAEQWAKKAVELAPLVADFHDTLGWVYHAQARPAEAEKSLKKAVKMQPSPQFLYHLGLVYQKQGKNKEAIAAFNQSLAIQKDFTPSQRALTTLRARSN